MSITEPRQEHITSELPGQRPVPLGNAVKLELGEQPKLTSLWDQPLDLRGYTAFGKLESVADGATANVAELVMIGRDEVTGLMRPVHVGQAVISPATVAPRGTERQEVLPYRKALRTLTEYGDVYAISATGGNFAALHKVLTERVSDTSFEQDLFKSLIERSASMALRKVGTANEPRIDFNTRYYEGTMRTSTPLLRSGINGGSLAFSLPPVESAPSMNIIAKGFDAARTLLAK